MDLLWLGILGVALGCLGTIIGAGGGFILMPILVLAYPGAKPEHLTAMSLAVVFCNALSGTIGYARLERIDYRSALIYAAAAIPGSVIGVYAGEMLPRAVFDVVLGVTLAALATVLLTRTFKGKAKHAIDVMHQDDVRSGPPSIPHTTRMRLIGISLSAGVGFVSSLLGIGGGIIHVPALTYLLGFPIHVAAATSHMVLAITAGIGTAMHLWRGDLADGWTHTLAIGVGAVIGAQLGARLSQRVPAKLIMGGLATAILIVGVRIVVAGVMGLGR